MCGRYSLAVSDEELIEHVKLEYDIQDLIPELVLPRYNIAPGQKVLAIINDGNKNKLGYLTWGYPVGTQDISHPMINAKAETIEEKPSFAPAFQKRRCLILANGFYEWKREGSRKVPMHICMKTGEIFAFAGVWTPYLNNAGQKEYGCAIITTTPNALMEEIHHRMPVIIPKEKRNGWLTKNPSGTLSSKEYLLPYDANAMVSFAVKDYVNAAANDDSRCLVVRGAV